MLYTFESILGFLFRVACLMFPSSWFTPNKFGRGYKNRTCDNGIKIRGYTI